MALEAIQATATNKETNNMAMTALPKESEKQCMICFDTQASVGHGLVCADTSRASCSHWTCRPCLETYLKHCENDRKTTPLCPHPDCQVAIATELAKDVLGRAYTPKIWLHSQSKLDTTQAKDMEGDEEKKQEEEGELLNNDDKTFTKWLAENEEQVQQCEHCNVWIYREDGCEAMQCLCGYRFCWDCKMSTSKCECGWRVSDFYDNIRRKEGLGRDEELATEAALADFAKYYQQTAKYYQQTEEESDDEYPC